jgi:membrane protease YdiL (CAAX protease family)
MYAAFHYWICRLVVFSGWAEIGTIMLAFYGAMLALIYRRTGSIITTSIAHGLLTDMAAVMLLLDFLRRYPSLL